MTSFPASLWGRLSSISVKFYNLSLNRSRKIPPEAVGGGIFDCPHPNFRPEVDNDGMSGVGVDNVGVDVCVKIRDF